MLDIKFIRENPELVKESARKKHIKVDLDRLIEVDASRRRLLVEVEGLRAEKNSWSKRIPKLSGEERQEAIASMKDLGRRQKGLDEELRRVDEEYGRLMLEVPNVCAPEVPEGKDDAANVEIRRVGSPPELPDDFQDHLAIGEALDIIDVSRGVKIAGPRSYLLKGDGALLELALLAYATDFAVQRGFTPFLVPHLVKREAMIGTAYYPGGEEQAYQCERDDLSLIGTSEVSVTSYHMNETLREEDLPLLYAGISSCYRREAGTYGKDTRGLFRIHQFQKVEQVVICRADEEESARFHEQILKNAEDLLQSLELPYRVVQVCGGDLGRPQVSKYDIECYMPSRGGYGETHSASKFHDFQARRLSLRYRDASGKKRFAHTLNNTLIASPRILIPLLECHQQPDGSVLLPEPLRKYMGGRERLAGKTAARS